MTYLHLKKHIWSSLLKIYEDDIKPENFKDTSLDTKWYPDQDYHRVYIAKIKVFMFKEHKPFIIYACFFINKTSLSIVSDILKIYSKK